MSLVVEENVEVEVVVEVEALVGSEEGFQVGEKVGSSVDGESDGLSEGSKDKSTSEMVMLVGSQAHPQSLNPMSMALAYFVVSVELKASMVVPKYSVLIPSTNDKYGNETFMKYPISTCSYFFFPLAVERSQSPKTTPHEFVSGLLQLVWMIPTEKPSLLKNKTCKL